MTMVVIKCLLSNNEGETTLAQFILVKAVKPLRWWGENERISSCLHFLWLLLLLLLLIVLKAIKKPHSNNLPLMPLSLYRIRSLVLWNCILVSIFNIEKRKSDHPFAVCTYTHINNNNSCSFSFSPVSPLSLLPVVSSGNTVVRPIDRSISSLSFFSLPLVLFFISRALCWLDRKK